MLRVFGLSVLAVSLFGCGSSSSSNPPADGAVADTRTADDASVDDAEVGADTKPRPACFAHASAGVPLAIRDIQTLNLSRAGYSSTAVFGASSAGRFIAGPSAYGTDLGLGMLDTKDPGDLVIARLGATATAKPIWNVKTGGGGAEGAVDLAFTSSGALILAGEFGNSAGGGGNGMSLLGKSIDAEEYSDGYVARLSADGTSIAWLTAIGDQGAQEIRSINTDARDHVFVAIYNQYSNLSWATGKWASGSAVAGELDENGNVLWLRGTGAGGVAAGTVPRADGSSWFFAGIGEKYVSGGVTKTLKGTVRYTIDATGAEVSAATYDGIAMNQVRPSRAGGYVFVADVLASVTIAGTVLDPAVNKRAIGTLDETGAITWVQPTNGLKVHHLAVSSDGTIAAIGIVESKTAQRLGELTISLPAEGAFVARLAKDGTGGSLLGWGCAWGYTIGFEQDGTMTAAIRRSLEDVALDPTHSIDTYGVALVGLQKP